MPKDKKAINNLATEITYAQDKTIQLTVDDWIKKLEDLLKEERAELLEKIEKESFVEIITQKRMVWFKDIKQLK